MARFSLGVSASLRDYLGQYTQRVAISNYRIVSIVREAGSYDKRGGRAKRRVETDAQGRMEERERWPALSGAVRAPTGGVQVN